LRSGRANAVRLSAALRAAAERRGAHLNDVACATSFEAGCAAFEHLLSADPRLSAVISFNEHAIPGVMASATAIGRRIPHDLSVVSIDMPHQLAITFTPPMTTVGPAAADMGRAAVDLLIERVEDRPRPRKTQVLYPAHLNVRGSSGPPPGR
jgi:DNA-binding LacI/PurR family transcriptional regulator